MGWVGMASPSAKLRGDALANYKIACRFGVDMVSLNRFMNDTPRYLAGNTVVVDALLGTGLDREVRRPLSGLIARINESRCPVVSVDIPSGISSDSGAVMGTAVRADMTVTFGLPKRVHMLHPGAEY